MPRKNTKGELVAHLSQVGVFRDATGGGNSTLAGTPPAIDTIATFDVASPTNFAAADWVRIGALDDRPEINRIQGIATATITPRYPHAIARAVGTPVVEQALTDLGHISADGVSGRISAAAEDQYAANRRLWLGDLIGYVTIEISFAVLGWNLQNVATALGMLDTSANIAGTTVVADPERMFIDGTAIKQANDLGWYAEFVRKDGRTMQLFGMGCELDFTQFRQTLARGRAAPLPIQLYPTTGLRLAEID